ncbi:MAG: hypothetical protein U5J98_07310 [Halobacteriales archaeon]|nr:hypothetical protein [Halobacteriales archaeon]
MDRDIGMVGAVAIGVGTMIAAGIFVLSGLAVGKVGAAAIVSFLLAAVVAEADCDVLVERIHPAAQGDVGSSLLPTAGGPHAGFAGEVAAAIARTEGATIHPLHVVPPGATTDASGRSRCWRTARPISRGSRSRASSSRRTMWSTPSRPGPATTT